METALTVFVQALTLWLLWKLCGDSVKRFGRKAAALITAQRSRTVTVRGAATALQTLGFRTLALILAVVFIAAHLAFPWFFAALHFVTLGVLLTLGKWIFTNLWGSAD